MISFIILKFAFTEFILYIPNSVKNTSHTSVLWERERKISSVCMHSCNVSGNFHFRFSFLHEVKGIMCKMRCSCQRGMNESQKKRLLWENVVTSVKNTSHMTFTVCILYLLCVFIVFINEPYVLMNLFILIYRIRNCLSFSYKIILLWIFFFKLCTLTIFYATLKIEIMFFFFPYFSIPLMY